MSINKMQLENIVCSNQYDNGVAVPCGIQYGEVSQSLWSSWFPLVSQVNDGQSNKPNKDGLSLWRDGRGTFMDMYSLQDKAFFDVKAITKFGGIEGKKFELWAGSPVAGEKRSDAMNMTKDEVVKAFIEDSHNHQIINTLLSSEKPYILCIAYPVMSADNTWEIKCAYINVSAYLKHRKENFCGLKSKSGISGLIYRTKCQTSIDYNESISARVEVKFWDSLETLIDMGFACEGDECSSFGAIL